MRIAQLILLITTISIASAMISDTTLTEKTYRGGKGMKERSRFWQGKLCGYKEEYYRNGILKARTHYSNGLKNGPSVLWNENGKALDSICFYNNKELEHHAYYQTGQRKYYVVNDSLNRTDKAEFYTKTGAVVGSVDGGEGFFLVLTESQRLEKLLIVRNGECVNSASASDFYQFAVSVVFQVAHADSELYDIVNLRETVIDKVDKDYIEIRSASGLSPESAIFMNGELNTPEECVIAEYYFLTKRFGAFRKEWKVTSSEFKVVGRSTLDIVTIRTLKDDKSITLHFDVFGLFHKNF